CWCGGGRRGRGGGAWRVARGAWRSAPLAWRVAAALVAPRGSEPGLRPGRSGNVPGAVTRASKVRSTAHIAVDRTLDAAGAATRQAGARAARVSDWVPIWGRIRHSSRARSGNTPGSVTRSSESQEGIRSGSLLDTRARNPPREALRSAPDRCGHKDKPLLPLGAIRPGGDPGPGPSGAQAARNKP